MAPAIHHQSTTHPLPWPTEHLTNAKVEQWLWLFGYPSIGSKLLIWTECRVLNWNALTTDVVVIGCIDVEIDLEKFMVTKYWQR